MVYDLTGSALSLGWVSSASALSTLLLAPVGGVMADRFQKRSILIWARLVLIVSAFVIAALVATGQIQVWHIAMAAMLDGAVFAFMEPAQETLYSELVDRETVLNAVSLSFLVEGLLGIVGAAAAGLLIEAVGAEGVYLGLGLLFIAAGYTHVRLPRTGSSDRDQRSQRMQAGLIDGVRYVLALARMLFIFSAGTFLAKAAELGLVASISCPPAGAGPADHAPGG